MWPFPKPILPGQVWELVWAETNPFESQKSTRKTVLEVKGGYARCSVQYSNGLAGNEQIVKLSDLRWGKLLN